jgi:Na+/proline symporter
MNHVGGTLHSPENNKPLKDCYNSIIGDTMRISISPVVRIGLLVFLVLVLRPIGRAYVNNHSELGFASDAVLTVSMAAIAIITFFGFVWLANETGGPLALHKEGMRLAIVASVIVVDLVMVTTGVFAFGDQSLNDKAQALLNQFNTIVGIVVAFYFGSSAYVQVRKKEDKSERGEEAKN